MDDTALVENVKQGCPFSLQELLDKHERLFLQAISGLKNDFDKLFYDDLIESRLTFFYQTCLKFDKTKNCKFSTFLYSRAKFASLNIHNRKKSVSAIPIEVDDGNPAFIFSESSRKEEHISNIRRLVSGAAKDFEDPIVFEILKEKFFGDEVKTWGEVKKSLNKKGIEGSARAFREKFEKSLPSLKKKLNKESFVVDKF